MTRGARRLLVVAGALASAAAAADAPRDLSTLFPSQAPIFVEGRGVARLVLAGRGARCVPGGPFRPQGLRPRGS